MRFLLILSAAIILTGCSESQQKLVPVTGTVYIDGEPLDGGTIRFVPEIGRPASSNILDNGTFKIAAKSINHPTEFGLEPGSYRVQIASSEIVDDETIRWKAPQHYADFRTSGLKVVVDGSTADLKIELISETEGDADSPSDAPSNAQLKESKET
jgi:hypothetical protein